MSTLLLVHAHPDDEAISTGGVMARAHGEGRRVVLVTATRGEVGEIHNMDEAASRPRLAEIRTEELERAGRLLGVDRQEFLGYRDSGMAGTGDNESPDSFHRAPLAEAAERIAAILREEKPDVVVTYGADGLYGHPDHVKAHHATVAALDLLEKEGWQPAKAYFVCFPQSGIARMAELLREAGREDVLQATSDLRGVPDEDITAVVEVGAYADLKMRAFREHSSQNNPDSPFLNMQGKIAQAMMATESYVLARGFMGDAERETDLFQGIPR
jgi:N-acetyl-1-D-myo-inositol-2-amino-2-deoxy-alpha-D-glucopyranoside deacetylase